MKKSQYSLRIIQHSRTRLSKLRMADAKKKARTELPHGLNGEDLRVLI